MHANLRYSLLVILLLNSFTSWGQYQIDLVPRVSPARAIYQQIGYTEIEIRYSSPSVNRRTIWGDVVPYDRVWRAGANEATTVQLSQGILVEGQPLPKGKYSIFVIPRINKKWTVIFNKHANQWGAFAYDEEQDLVRVDVLPKEGPFMEHLTYEIAHYGYQYGHMTLRWGNLTLPIEVQTNYLKLFQAEVENRAAKAAKGLKWVIYLQGAEHLADINTRLDLAQDWINRSEALEGKIEEWNPNYYPRNYAKGHICWVKARILALEEEYEEALNYAEKLPELGEPPLFYQRERVAQHIDEQIDRWRKS